MHGVKKIEHLSLFSRLIPEEGVKVYPGIWYVDVNDIPRGLRISTKEFFFTDKMYGPSVSPDVQVVIQKGNKRGTRYCVYAFLLGKPVGNIIFQEYLDNPHGYGKNDFLYHKWIYPDYRHLKESRYIISDLMHIMFVSGAAARLYCYLNMTDEDAPVWKRALEYNMPCRGVVYGTDSSLNKTCVAWKNVFKKRDRPDVALMEMSRDSYLKMDLKAHLLKPPHRTEKVVDRWLKEITDASHKVEEQLNGRITS